MLIGVYKTCLFLTLLKICNSHLSIIESMADSSLRLTEGQLQVLELVESGHNVCLVGKAGKREKMPHCVLKWSGL